MASLNIPELVRAKAKRQRRPIALRPIEPTQSQADELAAILLRVVSAWVEAAPRILAAYQPKPLGDALTHDDATDAQKIIAAIQDEVFTRIVATINPLLRAWALRTERWHRNKWTGAVKAATGIDLSTVLTAQPAQETLASFLARNAALVKNISDEAQARIADAVFRGYQARTPYRQVASEIAQATGMAKRRAVRVASDQSSKLASALDAERMAEAGFTEFKYRHSFKQHPRPWHAARDGKIYELVSGKQVGGPDRIEPGDGPGEPPYCGCRRQAYLPPAST